LTVALLAFTGQAAMAAQGLVANTRVTESATGATLEINFNCKVNYEQHEPQQGGDVLRVFLTTTSICNGVAPSAAQSRGRFRPARADLARLTDLEYNGDSASGPMLTLNFSEPVTYEVDAANLTFRLLIHISLNPAASVTEARPRPNVLHRRVERPEPEKATYVVNLVSYRRIPTIADAANLTLQPDQRVFYTEALVDGTRWYRLRIGDFESAAAAGQVLQAFKDRYPEAWIDTYDDASFSVDLTVAAKAAAANPIDTGSDEPSPDTGEVSQGGDQAISKVDELMNEAKRTMIAGDRPRAIQIYTKVLQLPPHPRHPEAQELLALAREKNGQIAHAKAEYQRYLSLYADKEGAARVAQRLAALIAGDMQVQQLANSGSGAAPARRSKAPNDWRVQTFFSQYYRRDANQLTDQEEIISQSALYSDVNVDARRRGERYDFQSRLSLGYRKDFLDRTGVSASAGDQSRVSYAYADLADAKTGLRGRIGRQSRNTGGVLGRFDGINLGYQANERLLVNATVGKPAYSANDGVDSARTFYGASLNYGPLWDGLELGLFFIQQNIEGMDDRRAVGGEFRYFGENKSAWGQVDYDMLYGELGSAFLQASWRLGSRFTVHGSIDQRHSPFLSTGNALIGQPVLTFAELTDIFSEDELRQLGLDRSPTSRTFSLGASYTLSPRLQLSVDANDSAIDASPASGGVLETPASNYRYFSTNLVASGLLSEGDVSILGLRYSDSDTSNVMSVTLDSRMPFGGSWRINPRLRVDRRERLNDANLEWIYTPGLRLQYRRSQKLRIELEAGKQFAQRDATNVNMDRESYFISLGYQAFF
jgi:hypothetical protein